MLCILLFTLSLFLTVAGRQCRVSRPSPSSVTTPSSATQRKDAGKVAGAWYAGWRSQYLAPEDMAWSKYTVVTYAFALTSSDSTAQLQSGEGSLLQRLVQAAHQHNVNASLSIGGWTGSRYFSPAVATAASRSTFVNSVVSLVKQYNLDAIDFDWEYPNKQGIGCNAINPSDSANFLSFLQQLKSALKTQVVNRTIRLTAAVNINPFNDPNGAPMTDVSAFAKVLDYIEIMAYDIWGFFSKTGVGPNAPLDDSCAPAPDQQGSATSAVKAWTNAKFPASQIVLGVAAYGHSFLVTETNALPNGDGQLASYPQFNPTVQPKGDSSDIAGGYDPCGNYNNVTGTWDFWGLIEGGYLTSGGTPAQRIDYRFDSCSQTPYVYNPATQVMVSYDNAKSFSAKGSFIANKGLAGFSMWEASGDKNNILLNSITGAIASGK